MSQNQILLPGCTPEPLMSYLKALGFFRLVSEQADPHCRAAWQEGRFLLTTALDRDALTEFFTKHYQPSPHFSPWNGDGGFLTESGASFTTIEAIRSSTNPRLAPLRDAIAKIEKMTILKEFGQCRADAKDLDKRAMQERLRGQRSVKKAGSERLICSLQAGLFPCSRRALTASPGFRPSASGRCGPGRARDRSGRAAAA